jgi:hypothetical protein
MRFIHPMRPPIKPIPKGFTWCKNGCRSLFQKKNYFNNFILYKFPVTPNWYHPMLGGSPDIQSITGGSGSKNLTLTQTFISIPGQKPYH